MSFLNFRRFILLVLFTLILTGCEVANIYTICSPKEKNLYSVITCGKIPSDLAKYDEQSQAVFGDYLANSTIVFRYVLPVSSGNMSGSSWANAATNLGTVLDGIKDASSSKIYAVLLGPGEYKPGKAMSMKNYVTIVGGISEVSNTKSPTILSGENSYRVFANNEINNTARLYGVTIKNGKDRDGGGMQNSSSSPVLTRVVFSNNTATNGGGMVNFGSSPVLTEVVFSGNTANSSGGGIANQVSSPILTKVVFSGNTANSGGGIYNYKSSSPILTGVVFSGNTANEGGGIVNNNNTNNAPIIVNSIFWGNRAGNTANQIHFDNGTTAQENLFLYNSIVEGGMPAGYTSGTTVTGFNSGGFTSSGGTANIVVNFSDIITTDPGLSYLTDNGGGINTMEILTTSPAVNQGLYVKRKGSTHYYRGDNANWYSSPDLTGTAVTPPADAIDLTATDMTGYSVSGRPDIGVYEARQSP